MASPYAAQLSRLSSLQGSNMAALDERERSAQNLAKLEYQQELDSQRKAMKKQKKDHDDNWWKRGIGSAIPGMITGALAGSAAGGVGAIPGALAGGAAGFIGSAVNDKMMDGAMGGGFGMQLGAAAGQGVGGYMANQAAQLDLPSARMEDLSDAVLSDPSYANYQGYSSLGGPGEHGGSGSYYGDGGSYFAQRMAQQQYPPQQSYAQDPYGRGAHRGRYGSAY